MDDDSPVLELNCKAAKIFMAQHTAPLMSMRWRAVNRGGVLKCESASIKKLLTLALLGSPVPIILVLILSIVLILIILIHLHKTWHLSVYQNIG